MEQEEDDGKFEAILGLGLSLVLEPPNLVSSCELLSLSG